MARTVIDAQRLARCERPLHPWVNSALGTVIAIEPGKRIRAGRYGVEVSDGGVVVGWKIQTGF